MNTFVFRMHFPVRDALGSHVGSNTVSVEADNVDNARAEIHNATPNLIGLDHIGTIPAPGAHNNVNRGSW